MPPRGKAKILNDRQIKTAIAILHSARDRLMFLLSVKAALRAMEIAGLRWGHVRGDALELTADICKKGSARTIPMQKDLAEAMAQYKATCARTGDNDPVFLKRGSATRPPSANAVVKWFEDLYCRKLGWEGYRSHSGRRTAITNMSRRAGQVGASIKDVSRIAGHRSIETTQEYIDGDPDAQKKLVDLI